MIDLCSVRGVCLPAAIVAALVLGCTASSGDAAEPSGGATAVSYTSVCSAGPAHAFGDFPFRAPSTAALPACVPRCGAVKDGDVYLASDLPSGACTTGEGCSVRVSNCSCGGLPVGTFECSCESGQWRCYIVEIDRAVCLCDGGFAR